MSRQKSKDMQKAEDHGRNLVSVFVAGESMSVMEAKTVWAKALCQNLREQDRNVWTLKRQRKRETVSRHWLTWAHMSRINGGGRAVCFASIEVCTDCPKYRALWHWLGRFCDNRLTQLFGLA